MHEGHTVHRGSAIKQARAIWARRKWLGIVVFLAPFATMISLVVAMPDLYRAETTILVKQDTTVDSAATAGGLESRLQMISEEILSRSRLQALVDRFELYPNLRKTLPPDAVIERMRKDIGLKRKEVVSRWGNRVTVAFTLTYQSWNPQTAAEVVNTLAASYVEENEKLRRRQIAGTLATDDVDKLAKLKRRLAQLEAQFSDRYPDVVQLKAEIATLERQRDRTQTSSAATAQSSTTSRPDPGSKRQFQILDPALAPREPAAPGRLRLMVVALIFAVGAAGVAVLLAEQFDTSFHRVDELWAFTRVPILASIPRIVTRADRWRSRLRVVLVGLFTVSVLVGLVKASWLVGQNAEQVVWILAQRGV